MELVKIENLNELQNEQETEFDKGTVPQIKYLYHICIDL